MPGCATVCCASRALKHSLLIMMNNTERHAIRLWLLAGDARPIMTIVTRRSKGPASRCCVGAMGCPLFWPRFNKTTVKNPSLGRALPRGHARRLYDAVESLVLELEASAECPKRLLSEPPWNDCANPERFKPSTTRGAPDAPIGTRCGHGVFSLRP